MFGLPTGKDKTGQLKNHRLNSCSVASTAKIMKDMDGGGGFRDGEGKGGRRSVGWYNHAQSHES
jgi:hypothetical protein